MANVWGKYEQVMKQKDACTSSSLFSTLVNAFSFHVELSIDCVHVISSKLMLLGAEASYPLFKYSIYCAIRSDGYSVFSRVYIRL